FLGKLASCGILWVSRIIHLALRDRPGATVLLAPERTARVDKQHLEPASTFTVGQNACAQGRSPGSLFLRSHIIPVLRCKWKLEGTARSETRRPATSSVTSVRNRPDRR